MSKTPRNGDKPEVKTAEFTTSSGVKVLLKPVDPIFIQSVSSSVKIPKTPTYEVTTVSGRVERHKMDAKAAEQLPDGTSLWQQYIDERNEAQTEQSNRILRAILYMGTEVELPSHDWEKKFRFLGIDVPDDPDERRVFYLTSELTTQDTMALMTQVMRLTGVDEEVVQRAEEAFRNPVP